MNKESEMAVTNTVRYYFSENAEVIQHEYNIAGQHRITFIRDDLTRQCNWTPFNSPIIFGGYIAFTDYFGEDVFRCTKLNRIEQ